ncbi:hypothetical protein Tco_0910986 [Tanacetum coccineum]|uniref:Uncharacterized protein n=1 Tax=Tanacetum coccineum TaxID=301880 RepID=A0ABQ5CUH4_9ASTR
MEGMDNAGEISLWDMVYDSVKMVMDYILNVGPKCLTLFCVTLNERGRFSGEAEKKLEEVASVYGCERSGLIAIDNLKITLSSVGSARTKSTLFR